MDSHRVRWSLERVVVVTALAVGAAAGSYGLASAASGSSSGSSGSSGASGGGWQVADATPSAAPNPGRPWGRQRSDETPLTGNALSKVTALAKAEVPGGTIVRVETDADGDAAYEAHMMKADGTPVTVYVSKQFDVVSVESGMPAPPGRAPAGSSGASA